jgi:hypothetical protein
MEIRMLSQEPISSARVPEIIARDGDWTTFTELELGPVVPAQEGSEEEITPVDSLIVVDGEWVPDTWTVVNERTVGFRSRRPVVDLEHVGVADFRLSVGLSKELAEAVQPGAQMKGVATDVAAKRDELYREKNLFIADRVIEFEADPSISVADAHELMIPVARLHCPKHAGCTAAEDYAVGRSEKVEAKVKLVTVGAGIGTDTKVDVSSHWDATDGACIQYSLPAVIRQEFGRLLFQGKAIPMDGLFSCMKVEFLNGAGDQDVIPPHEDGCEEPRGDIDSQRRLKAWNIRAGNRAFAFDAVTTVTGKLSLGGDLPAIGTAISFEYTREVSVTFTRSITLSPGASYLAYTRDPPAVLAKPEHAEILWSTKRIRSRGTSTRRGTTSQIDSGTPAR